MSTSKLPERASLEFLRKLAKQRLNELRADDPTTKLAAAQLAVAREHGLPSWRALVAEVERRRAERAASFLDACAAGDASAVRDALDRDPSLVHERRPQHGSTGLHLAAAGGHVDALRLLLEGGADPDARDSGDRATALHFAAGGGHLEAARALLDAGADVHGRGDLHEADVIGWASSLRRGDPARDVVALLLERGARHHVFSAIAVGDAAILQQLVEDRPDALDRRMSRFEQRQTPLHFAAALGRHDLIDVLIDLGADLEAEDAAGHTALASAMLRGDRAAMSSLRAAGAREPEPGSTEADAGAGRAVVRMEPMLRVRDMRARVAWYRSIGFSLHGSHEEGGELVWAMLSLGGGRFALSSGGNAAGVTLWFTVGAIEPLYRQLKARQLAAARADAGEPAGPEVRFEEDLYEPFYGGRQFSVSDPGGVHLVFHQP